MLESPGRQTHPPSPKSSSRSQEPQSIPRWVWPEVFRLYGQGLEYQAVADALIPLQVSTTKSLVGVLLPRKSCP